jgi:hypothetical protein
MSYTTKSKYTRVPFHINRANGVNDDFTVSFKPKTATRFRASDEFTKYIDDDYSKFLRSSLTNSNAARDFTMKNANTQTEPGNDRPDASTRTQTDPEIRRPSALIEGEYDTPWFNIGVDTEDPPDLEPIEEEQRRALEARVARMSEMGRGMTSNDTFFDAEEGTETFYDATEGGDDFQSVLGDEEPFESDKRRKLNPKPVIKKKQSRKLKR